MGIDRTRHSGRPRKRRSRPSRHPHAAGVLTPADVVVELYRDQRKDEEPNAGILQARPSGRNSEAWTDYDVGLTDLSGPLDAYTARALPRDAVERGPLALPLIIWQR